MSNMSRIVNTKSNCNNEIDAGYHIYGEAPEMNKSSNIYLEHLNHHLVLSFIKNLMQPQNQVERRKS